MRRAIHSSTIGLAIGCVALLTGFTLRWQLTSAAQQGPPVETVAAWREIAAEGRRVGPADAAVTVVEFADYQCTYCAQLQDPLERLQARHPGTVALVYRHFPIQSIHEHAFSAAAAAECAGDQGRFEAAHRVLYQGQRQLGTTGWDVFAREAGVPDLDAFRACMTSRPVLDRIDRDVAAGETLNLRGTPALLVNDKLYYGRATDEDLDALVQAALDAR